jgi:FixJ family two-component response regulator
LAALSPGRFDCLITDLHLPGISGLELQRRLKVLGSSIPVIVITSSLDSLSRSRAMQEGAFAYLTKPFSDEALISHVKAALDEIDRLRKPADSRTP